LIQEKKEDRRKESSLKTEREEEGEYVAKEI
jgi:hypothetical protein